MTQAQFRNGLSQLGLTVTTEETELMNKAFAGSAPGYVDYVAFACAVDESERIFSTREPRSWVEQSLSQGFRKPRMHADGNEPGQPGRAPTTLHQPKYPVEYPYSPALEALLAKLRHKASQHRLRIADAFIEFDKHNDGTITQPQFIKRLDVAFDKIGIGLSESEVEVLVKSYAKQMRHGAVHVQWRKFVADVDKVFTTVGMEKDPAKTPMYTSHQQMPKTLSPPSREAAVQKLIVDLRKRVEVRRVLVKPLFSDYGDWSHSTKIIDHMTRQQMVQSLSRFGVELTTEDQALLFDRYDTLGLGTVNYVALVRDIDAYEQFSGRQQTQHVFPQDPDYLSATRLVQGFRNDKTIAGPMVNVQPGRPPTSNDQPSLKQGSALPHPPDLATLLGKLQRTAVQQRLRVEESFKDFDRHRDGSITVPQFQSAVAMTWGKFTPLTQGELELLVRTYAVDRSGQGHVAWKAFVSDVNKVFNADKLEKTPYAPVPPLVANLPMPKRVLSPGEEAAVEAILGRMRHHCHVRRVLVKPFFTDCEYNRRSSRVVDHVTKTQFGQVLSRLGLEVTNDELALLQAKFDAQDSGFINYVAFSVAIDDEEKNSNRESSANLGIQQTFRANGNFKATKTSDVQPGRPFVAGNVPGLLSNRASAGSLGALMRRLQDKVVQFKIPIIDFFCDYDRHKIGAISSPHFRRGMNFAFGSMYVRESITAVEMEMIEQAYAREMLDGAIFVDWKEFCKDINSAVFTPNLESAPHTVPDQPYVKRATVDSLTPAEEERVQALLSAMRQRFKIRQVYVKAPFHDFAQSNNSPVMIDHVTRQQFVQGLARLGIEPSAEELELLFKKYDDAGDRSVNYVAFSTDVDATETFSTRERLPASPVPNTSFYGGFRFPKVHEELLQSMH